MREIKFRAWDKDNKEMFEPAIQLNDSVYKMIIVDVQEDKTHFAKIENAELMEYTGLKDKNGKEIYEGDIITVGNLIGAVEYSEAWTSFTIRTPKSKILEFRLMCDLDVRDEEVIGNIHEKPELLEGE